MIRAGTPQEAAANRRKLTLPNGTGYFRSEFITSGFDEPLAPQSFLVEQDPDSIILPHFHVQNEFQVIVRGGGSFGRHAVHPLGIHYAGAHTGYGPITAGAEGLWYFTLRARMDQGARFLPEARDQMQRIPKRQLLGEMLTDAGQGAPLIDAVVDEVFAPQDDGIGAWLMRLPGGGAIASPVHPGGLGRFYLIAAGSAHFNERLLDRWATVFVTPEDEPVKVRAGVDGAKVLVLQFPQAGA